jgi:hypothetical protein
MHYHNVFLIKSADKKSAVEQTKKFLEKFDENLEVAPYKEYLSDTEFKRMQDYYSTEGKGKEKATALGINTANKQDLIGLLEDWDGNAGGIDEKGVYYIRTRNPQGEWDWYTIGGRWLWSKLTKKYEKYIIRPDKLDGSQVYWNEYHDQPIIGKKCIITFPDKTQAVTSYGMNTERAITDWVRNNPYETEVLDATNPQFFKKIKHMLRAFAKANQWWTKQQAEYKAKNPNDSMIKYYQDKKESAGKQWQIEAYFWNITDNTNAFDKDTILNDPNHWFIVNMDFHT